MIQNYLLDIFCFHYKHKYFYHCLLSVTCQQKSTLDFINLNNMNLALSINNHIRLQAIIAYCITSKFSALLIIAVICVRLLSYSFYIFLYQ